MFTGDLTAEAVDIVVVAFYLDDMRLIDQITEHLRRFEISGNKYIAVQIGGGGVSRHGVRQVAGRRAGHRFEAELTRACEGYRDDTILKRQGRMIDRVVFNIELIEPKIRAEVLRPYERSESGVRPHKVRSFDRQQVQVAPHAARAIFDFLTRNSLLDLLVVVLHLKGTEAHFADVDRFRRVFLAALATHQRFHFAHRRTTLSNPMPMDAWRIRHRDLHRRTTR